MIKHSQGLFFISWYNLYYYQEKSIMLKKKKAGKNANKQSKENLKNK